MDLIKLLIVDDSALMRSQMRRIFEVEDDFQVKTCKNGVEALSLLQSFQPDVIALDINMPEMDGLTALSHIMVERPTPVIMVSSLTKEGALATLEALALGAIDFVTKPGGTISLNIDQMKKELLEKIRMAAGARLRERPSLRERMRAERQSIVRAAKADVSLVQKQEQGLVMIGVSTGGPRTLEEVLPLLPEDFPWPVVVAQHMPASFTCTFASRMDKLCPLRVVEVIRPTVLQAGEIYIAGGGADLILSRRSRGISLISKPMNKKFLWHPSVDQLVSSALLYFEPSQLIGVLMTGMGYDGADSMKKLYDAGGRTIAESEQSCVVFGMPAVLIKNDGATSVLPCHSIANKLVKWVR